MKTLCKKYLPWIAVAAWMVVIFWMSAQTAGQSGGLSEAITRWILHVIYQGFDGLSAEKQESILAICHTILRKGAHFMEYAVLAMLVANALRQYPMANRLQWLLPVAVSAAYAVTDEIHQYFVPDRACRFWDVCIDTAGAACGIAIFLLWLWIRKGISPKR